MRTVYSAAIQRVFLYQTDARVRVSALELGENPDGQRPSANLDGQP
jgi:hypothetical protein